MKLDKYYKERLARVQKACPVCGLPVHGTEDAHHWLVRRMKGRPELDVPELNVLLVHSRCHVPPGPDLDYKCARMAFQLNPPEVIEDWLDSLDFRVKELPAGYVRARDELRR